MALEASSDMHAFILSPVEVREALALRGAVWRHEGVTLPLDPNGLPTEPLDATATHVGVRIDGELVAAARFNVLSVQQVPFAAAVELASRIPGEDIVSNLSRLVVQPHEFGHHLAGVVVKYMIAESVMLGVDWITTTALDDHMLHLLSELRFRDIGSVKFHWGGNLREDRFFLADASGSLAASLAQSSPNLGHDRLPNVR